MLESAGSDLLLSVGSSPRIRKDGVLVALDSAAPALQAPEIHTMLCEVLDSHQLKALSQGRNVDFAFTFQDRVRVRGNAYLQRGTPAAAFRSLPLEIPTFEQLGVPEAVYTLVGRNQGLILVTGPTGSGKSTTQAAMIDYINRTRACHVVTVEDPIEYVHQHRLALVDQRQVGIDTRSFADALRSAFREDPDVILIGEMRDVETMRSALTIAETGHLVLATLHTNDAPQAINRIVDSFAGPQQQQVRAQLAACLTGVIYQQLVPAVGGGRVAAFEVLVANVAVRSMIKDGKTDQIRSVLLTNLRQGSQTLERSLNQLLRAGLVTERDARAHSLYPGEIQVASNLTARPSRSAARQDR
ncbi:MAG: PilT/PilU family type 4a pilus ATPase [Chloroflexi bacterium]|nr:MAG: PilT/PilU family type 4a pilus ATPase [Chloroflexota bacterium]TME06500.1 MAG: PilT/PilU family type 4a pilus ATPase [Chloroflexota bacterium]TME43235.1 MAG: PilT/PilU family type 4a pilus ATPase [Chloroflexota bacterium]